MSKVANLLFVLTIFVMRAAPDVFSQTVDPLVEANRLYAEKKFAQAAAAYKSLTGNAPDEPTDAKMLFNLGMSYQKLRQYDKAVETFERILKIEVDQRKAIFMMDFRHYRSNAQWEIGDILFKTGDYAGALAAYRTKQEKYRVPSCTGADVGEYILHEAIILEHLGNYDEAVKNYWKLYDPRLAEIYHASGQLNNLWAIVYTANEMSIAGDMRRYGWTREKASEYAPTKYLKEAIAVYGFEKAQNWRRLIKSAALLVPFEKNGRGNIAMEILARHSKQVFPIIMEELSNPDERMTFYLYFRILGLLKTDESVAFLKEEAVKEQNWHVIKALVRALDASGEKGATALKELEPAAKDNLKLALERRKTGELEIEIEDGITFPALVYKGSLPSDL